ncbi:Retinoblastoma-like protein 1, partial [Blyttiomyces sp. JEL0837]
LPKSVIKRLCELQERIGESELWKDEFIYNVMRLACCNETLSPHDKIVIGATMNFYGEVIMSLCHRFQIPPSSNLEALQCFLLNNICRLAHERMQDLLNLMKLKDKLTTKSTFLLSTMLNKEPEYRMLSKRHIDVLILCCVYSACRVEDIVNVTFKDIVFHYSKQPHYIEKTVGSVLINDDDPPGDITKFYNCLFIPKIRPILKAQGTSANPATTELFSPLRKKSNTGEFVTPGRIALMTPMTRKLCSVGESPLRPRVPGVTSRASMRLFTRPAQK